jgi:hypothetical protein
MKKNSNHLMSSVINLIGATQLNVVENCEILKVWESANGEIPDAHRFFLEAARQELNSFWSMWNEEETKMHFVSTVLNMYRITMRGKIQTFYERKMVGAARGHDFSIICDCMIATPTNAYQPAVPYFFFQEFKKSQADSLDPQAQMLVAMLLAQEKNNDGKPIYGAFQQGKNWYFSVLNGDDYCLGTQFDATVPASLDKIVFMLQALKGMILNR